MNVPVTRPCAHDDWELVSATANADGQNRMVYRCRVCKRTRRAEYARIAAEESKK